MPRGGKRPGAGRPKLGNVRLSGPTLDPETAEAFKAWCESRDMSVGEGLRFLIDSVVWFRLW